MTARPTKRAALARTACVGAFLLTLVAAVPAEAQRKPVPPKPTPRPFVERGFVTLGAGMQTGAQDLDDRIEFEQNAETGTIDTDYPGGAGLVVDATAGFLVRRRLGVAVGVSHATRAGDAQVTAEIPHPFFDDQPRSVSGVATDISRTETAIHGQLYYDMRPRGRWRVRLFAGPSYFTVEQEVVTGVQTDEEYPFDTAEFRGATTRRAKGSAIGVNAGLEAARMFTRRVGIAGSLRYAAASIDLDADDTQSVSTTGGGLQAGLGLRILF